MELIIVCGGTGIKDELRCRQKLCVAATLDREKVLPSAYPYNRTLLVCCHRWRPIHDSLP